MDTSCMQVEGSTTLDVRLRELIHAAVAGSSAKRAFFFRWRR
jgi:hypothetical protein